MDYEHLQSILRSEPAFRYQLLDRMRTDCEYVLNSPAPSAKYLWAGTPEDQIAYMKAIWESFPKDSKPEWLSMEEIEAYEPRMKALLARPIRAMLIPVGDRPREVGISPTDSLKDLQGCVGGLIEPVDVLGDGITLYVNEEGLGTLPPNRALYATKEMEQKGYLSQMDYAHVAKEGELYTVLFGDIVAVSYNPEGELRDISPEQMEKLGVYFSDPASGVKEVMALLHHRQEPDATEYSLSSESQDMREASDGLDGNDHHAQSPDHQR